jgi:hypothetical protein
MPRRASAPIHPLHIAVVLLLVAAAIAGGWIVAGQVGDPYRTIPSLDVKAYLDNANSLRGNIYKIKGGIANQLRWNPDGRRLFSVEIDEGKNVEGSLVPLLVTPDLKGVNIQKGQKYYFQVEVIEGGLLQTRTMTKA